MKKAFVYLGILGLIAYSRVFAVAPGFDPETGIIRSQRWTNGVPLGGIGCGKIEVLTDGAFGHFTMNHNWDRPSGMVKGCFAAIHTDVGGKTTTRLLRLPMDCVTTSTGEVDQIHQRALKVPEDREFEGLEFIAGVEYSGNFPTVSVQYRDANLPVDVELSAFSPLIPHNVPDSSLPIALLTYKITNMTSDTVETSLAFSWQNLLGFGGNRNVHWDSLEGNWQKAVEGATGEWKGLLFGTDQRYEDQRQNVVGQYVAAVETEADTTIEILEQYDAGEDQPAFWGEFRRSGKIMGVGNATKTTKASQPSGAMAVHRRLKPFERQTVDLIVAWYMPNCITRYIKKTPGQKEETITEDLSHLYTQRFKDVRELVDYAVEHRQSLRYETLLPQNLLDKSNIPSWLQTKVINCAFPVFSNTILTRDGRFTVLESPISMDGALGTMDQRLASHVYYTMFFPELDKAELELFGKCQDLVEPVPDGRIPHFVGNIHEVVGNPNVKGGVHDWPDLSCSYVMQIVKYYRWTGDRGFLDASWPRIQRAMKWLEQADRDGDSIPEGGSTYDYETAQTGAFSYTASCYLGALKAAAEAARVENDQAAMEAFQARFDQTQKSVIKTLWNGSYFIKSNDPKTGKKNPNSFIAAMAGDWMTQLSGLGTTLPDDIRTTSVKSLIERHVKPFKPVPPMEVTPDGESAVNACYIIQNEPYLGMEAIHAGQTDDGLDVLHRVFECSYLINRDPWYQPLWVDLPQGIRHGLVSYMTSPATWSVLNALTGATLNLPYGTLYLAPRLPSKKSEWHLPIYFPQFWLWLDYAPKAKVYRITVLKTFGDKPAILSKIAKESGQTPTELKEPFVVKEGAILDLNQLGS